MRAVALVALTVTGLAACGHTQGAKPISDARAAGALGAAPVTRSLDIDVGVADVHLFMGEPQVIMESNLGRHDWSDSVAYALEVKPPGCAEPDVSPGRIAVRRREKDCHMRWDIRIPRIASVRVRVSVGDVEVVAPIDRAVRLHTDVGKLEVRLDGRELQHGRSPGSGDEIRLGDLETLPRLDVRTGVGAIRADFNTRKPVDPSR